MSITGLVAKENVVATASSLLHIADGPRQTPTCWVAFAGMFPSMGAIAAFGAFNLLCAPCFAAMGTIRAQMNSARWTAIAIGYECAFAWVVGLIINQLYELIVLGSFGVWTGRGVRVHRAACSSSCPPHAEVGVGRRRRPRLGGGRGVCVTLAPLVVAGARSLFAPRRFLARPSGVVSQRVHEV